MLLVITCRKMASSSREIVLTSAPESPIIAYDASSGATLTHFTGSRSPRKGLTLAGETLIAASHISSDTASASIHLYNWYSSAAFHHIPVPEPVAPLTATPDGLYLFSGGLSGHIHVLSLPSGDLLRSFPAHSKPVSCLTINDDGSILVSGGDDGIISVFPILRLLDSSSDTDNDNDNSGHFTLHRFAGHTSPVTAVTSGMGGCNSIIISCSLDCTCKFWSLAHGTHLRTVRFPCMIWGVTVNPIESEFYAGGSDGRVYSGALKVRKRQLVSSGSGSGSELVAWAKEDGGAVMAVAMVNEGRNLLSASEDGNVRVWEVARGRVVRVLGQERGSISDIVVAKGVRDGGSFSSCGARFSSGSLSLGFSGRELISRQVREVSEMEEVLNIVVEDRRRAIDTFESAIGTYKRLLELILKEAKGRNTNTEGDEKERIL